MPSKPRYVFARTSTLIVDMAGRHRLRMGEAWHADHPVVRVHADLFSDDPLLINPHGWEPPVEEAAQEPKVEQATKAPGEKRATRRAD
jgi:hypothetical protein